MIGLTYFDGLTEPQGKRYATTWAKLVERLRVPRVSTDKRVPGLSLATYAGNYRKLENVEQAFAIGIDLDEGVRWDELRERFATSCSFVHSTWSSTVEEPRARLFLPLSRPVTADEYRLAYASVAKYLEDGGLVVDRQASDPSRFWYLPSHKPGAPFHCFVGEGKPINADGAIAAAPPPVERPPIPVRPRTDYGGASPIDRARAYLAACPPAISGSGGHTTTFMTAQRIVRGFQLTEEEAFALLANDWNPRCQPPWSESALRRKVHEAMRSGRMADGDLRDRERPR